MSPLRKNIFSGSLAAAGSIIISVVAYPVYLYFLGAELYGLWAILSVLIYFASIGNFGIDDALIKYVSEKYQKGAIEDVVRYISTGLNLLIVNGIILCAACSLLGNFFASILNLKGADIIRFHALFHYVVILSIFILVVNYTNAILKGLGRFDQASYILLVGRFIGLIMAVLFFINGYKIWGIYMGQALSFLSVLILSSFFISKRIGLYYKPFAHKKEYLVKLLKFGGTMTVSKILSILLEPFIKIVIARYIGLAEVTYFEIANKVVMQIRSLFERGISAIMPEVSRLSTTIKDAKVKISEMMRRVNKLNVLVGSSVFILLLFIGEPLLKLWLSAGYCKVITIAFRVIIGGYLINLLSVPSYYYFMGTGQVRFCFLNHLIQTVLNFILVVVLIFFDIINFQLLVTVYAVSIAISSIVLMIMYHNNIRNIKIL